MSEFDPEAFLNEVHYAWDFQNMIGDVEDFLDFSERNIEGQHRSEIGEIQRRAEMGEFDGIPGGYKEHLEENAEHRFKVTLPLRVRYAAVVTLTTSVEWSIRFLMEHVKTALSEKPKGRNETVHALFELQKLTGVGDANVVRDYEAIVHIRNCIAHSAGIEEHYEFRAQLAASVDRLDGFSLDNWHFLGKHICINKGALNPYVQQISALVIALHKATHEQGLLRNDI
jgi:hypothetical protein